MPGTTGNFSTAPAVVEAPPPGSTVVVIPGIGNTSLCEWSDSENALTNPNLATWVPWSKGIVSSSTGDVVDAKVRALRFSRVSGSSVDSYEIYA